MYASERHAVAERELPIVWRICVMRLAGFERSSIEDAAQEVFVRWLSSAPEFESEEHERAWFVRCTLNICTDIFRHASRHPTLPLDDCEYLVGHDDVPFSPGEREIIEKMRELPESCRDVVYLYFVLGYNTTEIAKILKKLPNTVRRELSRGRDRLKRLLGDIDY